MGVIDKRFVLLNAEDNIFVCIENVVADVSVHLEGKTVKVNVDIGIGHKIARKTILLDEKVIKYGVSIGSTTESIEIGEHVHLHNMKSDYIPTHSRQNEQGEK